MRRWPISLLNCLHTMKLSILMPVYNERTVVERCISLVLTAPLPENMERVVKGGSFLCHPSYCESYRPTARRGMPPDTGTGHTGFRCVMTPEEWAKTR